jgi:endoglucanase
MPLYRPILSLQAWFLIVMYSLFIMVIVVYRVPNAPTPIQCSGCLTLPEIIDQSLIVQVYTSSGERPAILYRGVSLAGGEFQNSGGGGTDAKDGNYLPTENDAMLFIYKGMNTFRIPVALEYIGDSNGRLFSSNESSYIRKLDSLLDDLIIRHNASIILELHNYMRYNPVDVGLNPQHTDPFGTDVIGGLTSTYTDSAFYAIWRAIVRKYNSPNLIYGIMNEPHDVTFALLNRVTRNTYSAIREAEQSVGSMHHHLILISGNAYTGLHSWFLSNNSHDFDITSFPDNDFAIEVHQYLDADSSGRYDSTIIDGYEHDCISTDLFVREFDIYWRAFKNWTIAHRVKIFLGEFGVPDTTRCKANVAYLLDAMTAFAYSDVQGHGVIGWTLWSAGNAWGSVYPLSLATAGKVNSLMWDGTTYERYLTRIVASIPSMTNVVKAIQIENKCVDKTLSFEGGYIPFQFQGSADIPPRSKGFLYSNDDNNQYSTPTGKLEIKFFYGNATGQLVGFGFDNSSPYSYVYQFNQRMDIFNITSYAAQAVPLACPIVPTGTNANPGEPRCFVVNCVIK